MMDFIPAESQQAVAALAAEILTEPDPWKELARAGLLDASSLGVLDTTFLLTEIGRRAPLPAVTLQTVGPTLHEHGTGWQQDFFLPQILAGEVHFAIGYTEPQAGTDLASLRTRAVRDGDRYVVDGQKIYTTGAHAAGYIWLACRTAPSRHNGITILIVDTRDPGFSWTPIITHDGAIEAGGRLPLNPHGGQLGEAYIHGMNGVAEAVRQIRGTAVNQVPGDGPVLVTAGTGVPTSGLVLAASP
jgi:alkylation response protein AidB-like acyl-CoA dehydrogenase